MVRHLDDGTLIAELLVLDKVLSQLHEKLPTIWLNPNFSKTIPTTTATSANVFLAFSQDAVIHPEKSAKSGFKVFVVLLIVRNVVGAS